MITIQDVIEVEFIGRVIFQTGNNGDWKAYAIEVDKEKYPNIKFTKYGNCSINGEMHELAIGQEYKIIAVEKQSSYGMSYKVINIKRDKPTNKENTLLFLQEILTHSQADILYNVYPNIIDKVINNDLDDIDLQKTKGIKEYTFDCIKKKIIENYVLVELVDEFQGMLSLAVLKKMYNKYASIKLIRKKMREEPYKCLCGLSGIGFKTADNILLELDRQSKDNIEKGLKPIIDFSFDLRTSSQRCLAAIIYLLEENENNGHTKMDIIDLKNQIDKLVPACSHHIIEGIKSKYIYFNKDYREIALKNTYETEEYIAKTLKSALDNNTVWGFDYSKYKNQGEFELSDEQLEALRKLCIYNVSILNGAAGVGKSATTEMIIKMLQDNNKTFSIFAPTGRASKVIAEYTKQPASTIHRGLGYEPLDDWIYNQENKLIVDIIIVDEFSMTDIFLCKHLFEAIDFLKTKLLIIGDNAQLPSVSCGNLLHDFMQSEIIPTTTLTKVFRYGEGGLMTVATDVRNGKSFLKNSEVEQVNIFGDNKDYTFLNFPSKVIVNKVVALYKKLLDKGYTTDDILVLSPTKKGDYGTPLLNNKIQKIANKNITSEGFKAGDTTYYLDDIVMQTVNNYKAKLYIDDMWGGEYFEDEDISMAFIANGEIGKIIEMSKTHIVIDFDGTKVIYSKDQMQNVSLGYAITVHKSQGGNAKIIILLTPQANAFMLNSNLIYVGLTRMKEKCYHLGSISTVNKSIKKKANFNRKTFMQRLLKQ